MLKNFFRDFDFSIPLLILIIVILGLAVLSSLVPALFLSQLVFFILGFILFFLFSQIDFRIYQNARWPVYFGCLFFLILTFVLGQATRGAVRWIPIGQFTIQPSEFVKPFLIVFFAFFFAAQEIKISKIIGGILLFLIPTFLIFRQPDLGSTLVTTASLTGILLAANISSAYLFKGIAALIIFLPISWFFLAEYQRQRLLSFLNPYSDPLGTGYNLLQAMISVGSGQFLGRGLGKGTQSVLAFLPERQTDFIFASFSEQLGFFGAVLLLFLYFFLLWRILKIAQNTKQSFARLFCLGVFFMLLFQIFVNVGMNMGMVPITGITLPFVSYGGSSILSLMISLGMVESIARLGRRQDTLEIK